MLKATYSNFVIRTKFISFDQEDEKLTFYLLGYLSNTDLLFFFTVLKVLINFNLFPSY